MRWWWLLVAFYCGVYLSAAFLLWWKLRTEDEMHEPDDEGETADG